MSVIQVASSYVLTHRVERLVSEGDKHIHWMCVVCLLFVEEEIEREKETVFGTNSTFKHVAQGETGETL